MYCGVTQGRGVTQKEMYITEAQQNLDSRGELELGSWSGVYRNGVMQGANDSRCFKAGAKYTGTSKDTVI